MTSKIKKLPGVMAFKRSIINTDGVMYNIIEGNNGYYHTPVDVVLHGIRGTQNINSDKAGTTDVSNIQDTETAKTTVDAIGMMTRFSLRYLPLNEALYSCAAAATGSADDKEAVVLIKEYINDFIAKANDSDGLVEVANRTARNILNGRWLWRNRSLGHQILISVFTDNGKTVIVENSDALAISMKNFNDYQPQELALGKVIAKSLAGKGTLAPITIEASIYFGFTGAVEVFPSQNRIENKPKGFSRSLYKLGRSEASTGMDNVVVGQAALRDQKVSNALRTIDTWYPSAEENDFAPIAVEPNGANLNDHTFYRLKNASSFELMRNLDGLDPNSDDGMFMIAAMMRAGVYSGQSDKKKTTAKKTGEVTAEDTAK